VQEGHDPVNRKQRDALVVRFRKLMSEAYAKRPMLTQDAQGFALAKFWKETRAEAFIDASNAIKVANLPPGQHVNWYEDRYLEAVTEAEKGKT